MLTMCTDVRGLDGGIETIPGLTDGELSCVVPKREWLAVVLVHALANAPSKAAGDPVTGSVMDV